MSAQPVIRTMGHNDLDGIVEVENCCFNTPWSRRMFEDELYNPNAHYLVLEIEGRIRGYAGFWKILDEGHITNIAVHPEHRGKGYGKLLISSLIDLAKDMDIASLTLEVRESNAIAISLYESFGFTSSGLRRGYYPDNHENALIMWLSL